MSTAISLTHLAQRFLQPRNSTQRVYEALRALCVDRVPAREAAQRFGYTPASFRVLVHRFRQDPDRDFFLLPTRGPQAAPKKDAARELIILAKACQGRCETGSSDATPRGGRFLRQDGKTGLAIAPARVSPSVAKAAIRTQVLP